MINGTSFDMPEAPEARTIAEKLRSRIKGKSFLWFESPGDNRYTREMGPIWSSIAHLFPSVCLEILCRGKQIHFFFENGIAFVSSLGLEGHWYYLTAEKRYEYHSGKNYPKFGMHFGKQISHPVPINLSEVEVWYDDKISYGNFTLTTWSEACSKMKEFGPDLLATVDPFQEIHPVIQQILPPEFFQKATLEHFWRELHAHRRSQFELCKFLMKQEYFCGIGNYLKSEILYRSRLHPCRQIGTLTDQQISVLFSVILNTIHEAYQCGGLTHGTFLDPDMQTGRFPVYIYKRAGLLDPSGYVIQYLSPEQSPDKRGTYFVPEIQL